MFIQNAPLAPFPLETAIVANTKTWQIGQILEAVVQGRDQKGLLEIKIGNNTLATSTSQAFSSGQVLNLKVIENKEKVVLENVSPRPPTTTEAKIEKLLRHNLPRQDNPQLLLGAIQKILPKQDFKTQSMQKLPKPVVEQLMKTQNIIATPQQLVSAKTLKQTIKDSGLFMEAKLTQDTPRVDKLSVAPESNVFKSDLKANLLRLLDSIESSTQVRRKTVLENPRLVTANDVENNVPQKYLPTSDADVNGELTKLKNIVESVVARLQINQTIAIVNQEQSSPVWLVELPIMDEANESLVKIEIQYDEKQSEKENQTRKWQIDLNFNIPPLGKIHVRMYLRGDEFSSSLWAEQQATNSLIGQNLHLLEKRLRQSGMRVSSLNQHTFPVNCSKKPVKHSSILSTTI